MSMYGEIKIVVLLSSLLFLIGLSDGETSYKNHHLYKIKLDIDQHTRIIREIKEHSSIEHYDPLSNEVILMTPPHKVAHINGLLRKNRIKRAVLDYDIQRKIIEESKHVKPANVPLREFGWENYYHLETIYVWLDQLAKDYDDIITKVDAGLSYEGVPLKGVKLSYKKGNKVVFIESGIHARERIAPATATFILHQLLTSEDPQVRDIAENFDWIIFPSINPDGYKYTFQEDRLWRKNRQPYNKTDKLAGDCIGVDLNRNWNYKWGTEDRDFLNPCGNVYPGPYPFSERETRQLLNFLKTQQIQVYLSLHSAAQSILFPYAATDEKTYNFDDLNAIARSAATAISKRYGTVYRYGNAESTIYPAGGTSLDFVYSELGIPIVIVFELRRDHMFILPAEEIISTGMETLDAIVALLNGTRARNYGSAENLRIVPLYDDLASVASPYEIVVEN